MVKSKNSLANNTHETLLITGATGFLGRDFVNRIRNKGFEIIIITTNKKNKIFNNKIYQSIQKFDYSDKDLFRISKLKNIFGIVHLATDYGRKNNNKKLIYNANYNIPLRLFKLIKKDKLNFYLNTDTYYERNIGQSSGLVKYVKSKKDFVDSMKKNCHNMSINFINCIIHHMYGPNDGKDKFIPTMIRKMKNNEKIINLTKGNQKKDFIHVSDVSRAIVKIIKYQKKSKNIINNYEIGYSKSYSIKFILIKLKKLIGSKTKLNFGAISTTTGEKKSYKANCKNLFKIGWKPKININKGLKNLK
ncbi:NAD-dependent epimerase/dehydratase family protein [Candidatus Pelagibacter sp. HIMB1695]|uniref:NAD-dependent epimerase/dehydratase family protein n=1 Tax=Candidatus Pelagibacter sp. HIMB1695 TaxID=3413364 RepID=UPI003F838E96